jgi:hypothetical protein
MSTSYSVFTIPLTNVPQQFGINIGSGSYLMTVKWNDADDAGWLIDLADGLSTDAIASNIPLITGADLLDGLEYLMIGGGGYSLIVYTTGDESAVPTLDNLGTDSNLYLVQVTTS